MQIPNQQNEGHIDDLPPDEWVDDLAEGEIAVTTRDELPRPSLDFESERLREAWVSNVRRIKYRATGFRHGYTPSAKLDGGRDRMTGKNYKPSWPRWVEKAKKERLDPVVLVDALFSAWFTDRAPFSPEAIFSDSNLARARKSQEGTAKKIASDLKTEEAVFRSAVWSECQTTPDKTAAIRYVLFDMSRALTPLFRYCLAILYGLDDVAHAWAPEAVKQFRRFPTPYVTAWGNILPTALKAEAARLTA